MKANSVLGALAVVGTVAFAVPVLAHDGLDVAPGGGFYTARDVAHASPRRMSHPYVGEPFAPSFVVRGSHHHINHVEMVITAKLNLAQVHHHHEWHHHR